MYNEVVLYIQKDNAKVNSIYSFKQNVLKEIYKRLAR